MFEAIYSTKSRKKSTERGQEDIDSFALFKKRRISAPIYAKLPLRLKGLALFTGTPVSMRLMLRDLRSTFSALDIRYAFSI